MLKWQNLIEHNNKYLLTSLALVKRICFDYIDRHVGQSSRREYSYSLRKDGNLSRPQMTRDMWTQIETQIGIELETRRNENSNLKQSMSILCNNCNMQICIGRYCHVLITTRSFIIIIIKTGWQCKAGRERLTPYQSEDPNPATPTHRKKEEKRKTVVGDKKWASS